MAELMSLEEIDALAGGGTTVLPNSLPSRLIATARAAHALREENERLRKTIVTVLADAESQHPGGWGPDVTTCETLRNALVAQPEEKP